MGYPTIPGLDRARYEAVLNAPLPNPLPANAVLVVGADWCNDTQHTLMDSGYPTQTQDGRPILYLNDANPAVHRALKDIPGASILGGGFDAAQPPSRENGRAYNYPTVLAVENGALSRVIYADTVPATGLTNPAALEQQWLAGAAERDRRALLPRYETARGAPLFSNPVPSSLEPNHVYAIVNSNCGHCHEMMARGAYPTHTEDGRPITYLNLAVDAQGRAVNEAAYDFYEAHLPRVSGLPTFITTDANRQPAIAAASPDAIIGQFFPSIQRAEAARGYGVTPAAAPIPVVADVAAAPPPPPVPAVSETAAAPPSPMPAAAPTPATVTPALQNELQQLGSAMVNGSTNPQIVAAVEAFYRATGNAPLEGPGTLTDTEMTAALNRMQLAAFSPDKHNELRTLGTALGVNLSSLNVPAAPSGGSANPSAQPMTAADVAPSDVGEGNKNIPDRRPPAERDASAGLRA